VTKTVLASLSSLAQLSLCPKQIPSLHPLLGTYCKPACISWLNYPPIVYHQQRGRGYYHQWLSLHTNTIIIDKEWRDDRQRASTEETLAGNGHGKGLLMARAIMMQSCLCACQHVPGFSLSGVGMGIDGRGPQLYHWQLQLLWASAATQYSGTGVAQELRNTMSGYSRASSR
jgi:hypothetical protein